MLKRFTLYLIATLGFTLMSLGTAVAASSSPSLTQSYGEASTVLPGMLVQLTNKNNEVKPLTDTTVSKMLGVVVPTNAAPIVLSNSNSTGSQVLVSPSGKYTVLVSNQDGPINAGDRLVMSSIAGVAMKAGKTQLQTIGQAETSFNGTNNSLGSEVLKNSLGQTVTESIGSVTTNVNLGVNPSYVADNSILPTFAIKDATVLAGKPVSTLKIILAAITLVVTLTFTCSLLYGGAKSRITALGRNPLAKAAIGKGILAIVGSGFAVFILGLIISYLFLKF
jgi:hypothetical protein